tara:strand:+ start:28 stop:189 length:162 start_codon:yes stop_codon:yes gene_type:complete
MVVNEFIPIVNQTAFKQAIEQGNSANRPENAKLELSRIGKVGAGFITNSIQEH